MRKLVSLKKPSFWLTFLNRLSKKRSQTRHFWILKTRILSQPIMEILSLLFVIGQVICMLTILGKIVPDFRE